MGCVRNTKTTWALKGMWHCVLADPSNGYNIVACDRESGCEERILDVRQQRRHAKPCITSLEDFREDLIRVRGFVSLDTLQVAVNDSWVCKCQFQCQPEAKWFKEKSLGNSFRKMLFLYENLPPTRCFREDNASGVQFRDFLLDLSGNRDRWLYQSYTPKVSMIVLLSHWAICANAV